MKLYEVWRHVDELGIQYTLRPADEAVDTESPLYKGHELIASFQARGWTDAKECFGAIRDEDVVLDAPEEDAVGPRTSRVVLVGPARGEIPGSPPRNQEGGEAGAPRPETSGRDLAVGGDEMHHQANKGDD